MLNFSADRLFAPLGSIRTVRSFLFLFLSRFFFLLQHGFYALVALMESEQASISDEQ